MRDPIRLTNSEMTTWRRCKRKWYLSTYRKLRRRSEEVAGNPLAIGNAVHDALAHYYGTGGDPAEFAKARYAEFLEQHPAQEVAIKKDADLVDAMLTGYVEWLAETGKDADLKTIAVETRMEVPLVEGVNLLSKIDERVEDVNTGERLAKEHKTVGSLKDKLPILELDTQLLTEHLVEFLKLKEEGKEQERAAGVLYNMLRKVKRTARATPPFYGREIVRHNVHELRNHWHHVVALAREIQDAERRLDAGESHHTVAYPSPESSCSWSCPFFGICKMFDDGSDVEAAIDDLYVEVDPLERYASADTYEEVT